MEFGDLHSIRRSKEEGSYRLHDLARIFADSRLDSPQRADAQYRHSKHYLKVLSEANKLYDKGADKYPSWDESLR